MIKHLFCAVTVAMAGYSPALASPGCPADLNNDFSVNLDDLLVVLNGWGGAGAADIAPPGAPNGIVNLDDVLILLKNWGPCSCAPNCISVTPLWCEDFELGNYSRWTGGYSGATTGCAVNGFSTSSFLTPIRSHRSRVQCTSTDSHRGYGGLRFQGNAVLPSFSTPSTGGINAPNGVAVTFWSWLDVPYTFSPTRWLSLMTVTDDCSNNWNGVVTLNLDDATMRLKPVHVSSYSYAPNAPSFPLRQWNRTTVYLNYVTGSMHVWQNGVKVVSASFSRPDTRLCQWHFGLYASGNNDDILLFEDSISIVKLTQPWTNFNIEPWLPSIAPACALVP